MSPNPEPAARRIALESQADSCFFRSRAQPGRRKALLKITDRCDLRCAHCFVSATKAGNDMGLAQIEIAVERLIQANVSNVTVTGGEPLVHPEFLAILDLLVMNDLEVTVCTNGVSLNSIIVEHALKLGRVRFNVSLDGFSTESHGKFRGNRESFNATVKGASELAKAGLLKGILTTPNSLANDDEYQQIFDFGERLGVDYVLMNPLSSFGRGIQSSKRLRADDVAMSGIRSQVQLSKKSESSTEAVFIRFPNDAQPISNCIAGEVLYVFVDGSTTVCPYLVFATDNPGSRYTRSDFIVANLFDDDDFADLVNQYNFHDRYTVGANDTCRSCRMESSCGKGCPAAVIARGGLIGDLDDEVCPVASNSTRTLACL
jgi:radical SAM protein with 4Fe4S-binding SPASM domain